MIDSARPVTLTPRIALFSLLAVMVLTACASEIPDAASDETANTLLGAETSCVTPNTGCACDGVGKTIDCGKVQTQVGDKIQCALGVRTCLDNQRWSECSADRIATIDAPSTTVHTSALATTTSVCAKNACDPYCKEWSDTPQGVDAGPGLKVTDAGLTLGSNAPITLVNCTGIDIRPLSSTTLTLNTLTPTSSDKLEFQADLTPAGCFPRPVDAIWTIDDARTDALSITSNPGLGRLSAISSVAGPVTVTAHIGSLIKSVLVNVNVDVQEVDPNFGPYQNNFTNTTGAAETATILYPYAGTVFPLGLPPPIPQWTAPVAANAVKLTLRSTVGTSFYKWSIITQEKNTLTIVPNTAITLPAAPRYPNIPALAWADFERSSKGLDAEIAVQRATSSTTYAEVKKTIHFANGQLKGNVYYQSYGTRLSYNYAGAQDSTGGVTFPSGKFGAATMGIAPGATTPKVIAGQALTNDTSGTYCRVCHTASADGSTLITQKFGGTNGASVMVTNLSAATPTNTNITAKTDGTYAWAAIYPTAGFLFGNGGVQRAYGSGPAPGGLDGSNESTTSQFWLLTSSSLGGAKTATYKTGGPTSKSIDLSTASWGLKAAVPSFSGTGAKIALQHYGGQVCNGGSATNCTADELKTGDKRSLAIMDWNNATSTASNFRVLNTEPSTACNKTFHPNGTCTDVWPSFLPNDTGVVYEREIMHNGYVGGGLSDFGGTRGGCDNSGICNNDGTKGEIWWVNLSGAAQPVRLNNANGLDNAGVSYLPVGADTSSYCTVSGFYCSSNAACCSGTCTNNRCTGTGYTPLRSPGTSCSAASQCETNKCNSKGVCGCLADSDCAGSSTCNTTTSICSSNAYAGPPTMSYVPGHNATVEPVLNYEPTVNPKATKGADGTTDEFYWVVFTSRRQFGNIATQNPWWSDPRHHDLSKSVSTKKLWVAAVKPNPAAGTDPSYPAFYLPGQEWVSGNSKAYWVQDACKVGSATLSASTVCDSQQDCCTGSICRIDAPVTSPPTRHCVPSATCASTGSACVASSDCCGGLSCAGGSCIDASSVPSFSGATYTRDFSNTCTPGFSAQWGTFEYEGTFPAGTSLSVNVRSAATPAGLATAPSVFLGTASTTTTSFAFLPTPAKSIDAMLASASSSSKAYLRVEMTLMPSADATAAPTIADWRVNATCTPSE